MHEADADPTAERPEPPAKVGGGTSKARGWERQTCAGPMEQAGEQTDGLLQKVVSRENLMLAHRRVVQNGGAPGVDGMTVGELMPYCRQHWPAIREQLLSGTYQPSAVRKVEIPKPAGGVRTLGIPTVLDRLIQQAISQVLTPIFDPTFSDGSFGFRLGRSTHQAVQRARQYMAAGHRWVVDLDLEKFFDRVNHDVLLARLRRRVKDSRLLGLIHRYLVAGMMEGGLVSPRTEGTPQGSPLSPLLSNVMLDDLDKELEHRGHRFVRYADDCNVYMRSRRAGQRVMASVERFLQEKLHLQVNRAKSAVARPWERKFLGYSVTNHHQPKLKVAAESVKRFKAKLRQVFHRGRGRSLPTVVKDLVPVLRGWIAYYRLADVKGVFEDLDQWIRRKLRAILWRQWKHPGPRLRALLRRGLDRLTAWRTAYNQHGPWWNAGHASMHQAVPTAAMRQLGLVSLLEEHRRLACSR